jgi:hypothetical protein
MTYEGGRLDSLIPGTNCFEFIRYLLPVPSRTHNFLIEIRHLIFISVFLKVGKGILADKDRKIFVGL